MTRNDISDMKNCVNKGQVYNPYNSFLDIHFRGKHRKSVVNNKGIFNIKTLNKVQKVEQN